MASNSPPNGLAEKQWRMSSRTGPACQACRKRKTRCALSTAPEGGACEYCDSAEIACSFAPKLLGPPKTYVESLELRLQVTQNLLRNLSTSAGVDLVALANRSATEPAGASQEVQQAIEALRLREGSVKPSASENLQLPPLPPLNPNRTHLQGVYDDRFAGKTAPHSFVNEILHDYVDGVQITAAGEQQSLVDHLIAGSPDRPTTFNFPLPPAEILQLFVDLFFSHFNGQLPLLHRPSFERALFAGLADSDASFRTLLFTVLAIGARWLDDPQAQRDWTPKALFISSCSLFNIRVFSSACPTLYDLQASALVVVHLLGAESSPCAWSAAGIGLRKLVDVGAHLETSEKWTRSPLEDQLRKRAFHLLYVLDRFMSASLGRPVAIQDEDFNLSYPLTIEDDALDEWNSTPLERPSPSPSLVEAFEWLARLAKIQGKILKRTHVLRSCPTPAHEMWPVVQELKAELDEWITSLPSHLSWSFAGAGSERTLATRAKLRGLFHTAQLALIAPFILAVVKARDSSLSHLSECFQVNMLAVWTWSEIMDRLLETGELSKCFYWIPINAGFPCLVGFHTLGGQLIGGHYLFRVAENLQTSIRALQSLKSSTPEAEWVFQSCKKLASHVNSWRTADQFDYEAFLLSPDSAPAELYLALPPFASVSEAGMASSLSTTLGAVDPSAQAKTASSSLDISPAQLEIFSSLIAENHSLDLFSTQARGLSSYAFAETGAKWPEDWAWREWQGR